MIPRKPAEGREIKLVTADFRIRAANLDAATRALRDDAQYGYDWTVRRNEKLAVRDRPSLPLPGTHVESVEAVFEALGFTIARDRAGGVRLTDFTGSADDEGVIINALRAVAPHVESRSSLTWEANDGSSWEEHFFRKKLRVRDFRGPFDMM